MTMNIFHSKLVTTQIRKYELKMNGQYPWLYMHISNAKATFLASYKEWEKAQDKLNF